MKTKTPVYDFVTDYLNKDMSRFHMPGHKGMGALGCEGRDITEIAGADYLLDPSGIIAESEMNASSLFATACTLYSTEGSTLAMKAMLRVAMMCTERQRNGRRFRILAGRNAHASFIHACALLDFDTEWLYGEGHNFVRTMLRLSEERDSVSVVDDQIGSPTSASELARLIHYLEGTESYGIYHGTCRGQCSWADLAEAVFKLTCKDIQVERISSQEYKRRYPKSASRPAYSVLSHDRLDKLEPPFVMKDWREALEEYLQKLDRE